MLPWFEHTVTPIPLPQAVIDQWAWWRVHVILLVVVMTLRITGADVAGTMVVFLMLCVAIFLLKDGMAELPTYACFYCMLAILNLFLDVFLLVESCMYGRLVSVPNDQAEDSDSTPSTTETVPLIAPSQGIAYNSVSVAMIVSPCAMLLGAYLSMKAYTEIQRAQERLRRERREFRERANGLPSYGTSGGRALSDCRAECDVVRFTGTPYKLDI
eukprot:TRINITY_DN70157_c0_g1_i1.p1 TRINITY_DN70157_c0_g1~~TRINITY_DN70157_c0_g1_i1.p1  ORF type:complete len:214 (-),score=19.30 TRINITY_DN70157_c0_g1_i1:187-828(-)